MGKIYVGMGMGMGKIYVGMGMRMGMCRIHALKMRIGKCRTISNSLHRVVEHRKTSG